MEVRLRFVARVLEGEAMSDLAREFGISRKTGYKMLNRYKEHGLRVERVVQKQVRQQGRGLPALRRSCAA